MILDSKILNFTVFIFSYLFPYFGNLDHSAVLSNELSKSVIAFQTLHHHKVNTTTAGSMKTVSMTKILVLNPNLAFEISYDRIWDNFQSQAFN